MAPTRAPNRGQDAAAVLSTTEPATTEPAVQDGTPVLVLNLLGTPIICVGEKEVTLETAKARALFYYLVVTGQPHSRGPLVDLLWSEMGEAQARRNLTATLTTLRKALGPYLRVEPERVAFAVDAPYQCDVIEFRRQVTAGLAHDDHDALAAAVALYRGDFLAGLTVKDAVVFEEWLFAEREQLRGQMVLALHHLVDAAVAANAYAAGLAYAQQLLALDPWREQTHRHIMLLHAGAGDRAAALAHYATCRSLLADELGVEPEPETQALYARLQRMDAAPPHNLPPSPNLFVGRAAELGQIGAHLADGGCRLVTLVGPGGVGKTRLAVEAARRFVAADARPLAPDFSAGVYWVELAGITPTSEAPSLPAPAPANANALITAIGEALQLTFQGKSELQGQLLAALKARACLLVLDNFEHLLSGTRHDVHLDLLAAILRHAPQVKLLVTSRERLNLQEEWVVAVEGLAYPTLPAAPDAPSEPITLQEAHNFGAVALFVARAQQAHPRFVPAPADLPHIVHICTRLEGLPLGIELAASWARDLTCAEIAQEIEAGLDFLATPLHNLPLRHQSLRAVFDHAWQRLSPDEQRVLCGLSLFRGTFSREAAAAIVPARLPTLARLADKSLVRRVGDGRYDLHGMLREYVAEQWTAAWGNGAQAASPETQRARYCDYYLTWVQRHEETLRGAPDAAAQQRFWQELDNVRQAWQWAVMDHAHALLAASLGGLARFYDVAGLFQEAEECFQQAASHLAATAPAELIVRLWIEQARHACRRGQGKSAVTILPQAVAYAEQLQSTELAARAHLQWAEATSILNDHPALREHAHSALRMAQAAARMDLEAEALRYCGIFAERMAQNDEAAGYYAQALAHFRQLGDVRGMSLALNNLGLIDFYRHDFSRAEAALDEALQGFIRIGDRWGQNVVLNNLGNLHFVSHAYGAARDAYQQGLALARALHDQWGESHLLHNLGTIACFMGRFEEADQLLHAGLQLRQEIGAQLYEGFSLVVLGVLQLFREDAAAALGYLEPCLRIAQAQDASWLEAAALTHVGFAQTRLEDYAAAVSAFERVIRLAEEQEKPDMAWEAMAGLAELRLALGDRDGAQELVETLLPVLEDAQLQAEIEPFQIHLSCYRVLAAFGDARAAAVLATAARQLHGRAARIHRADLRQSYLSGVPLHRALLHLAGHSAA